MNKSVEIDMRLLISVLMRRIWLLILCAVLLGALAFGYTEFFVTPKYQASVVIYVNSTRTNADGSIATLTASDLNTAQRLVATYVNILQSDRVLTSVSEEISTQLTPKQIREMMTADSVNETEVFQVKISNKDPHLAAEIANAIAHVAPEEIAQIVTGSSTKIIDYAKVPTEPYTPSTVRNTALGAIGGFLLAALVVILQVLLDVRIHDEADLAKLSDAPILGRIPVFDPDGKKENAYVQTSKPAQKK